MVLFLVMSSMLMNQQYMLNKVYLNRNTQNQSYVWSVENVMIRDLQEPNPVFPQEQLFYIC